MSNKRKKGESIDVYMSRKKNYIATLRKYGLDVSQIAKKLSISKSAFEKRIYHKPEWVSLWEDCNSALANSIEESLFTRIFNGTKDEIEEWVIDEDGEKVIIGGKTTRKQVSDGMLQFALRNLRSGEYNKDKQLEITGETLGNIIIVNDIPGDDDE